MEVNPYLPENPYRFRAPMKTRSPGSPKGRPKPPKRKLDRAFPSRLRTAMGVLTAAELSRKAGCERATIGNYLSGKNTTIDALTLLDVAGALGVDPRWLALGEGQPTQPRLPEWLRKADLDRRTTRQDRRVAATDRRSNGSAEE